MLVESGAASLLEKSGDDCCACCKRAQLQGMEMPAQKNKACKWGDKKVRKPGFDADTLWMMFPGAVSDFLEA